MKKLSVSPENLDTGLYCAGVQPFQYWPYKGICQGRLNGKNVWEQYNVQKHKHEYYLEK